MRKVKVDLQFKAIRFVSIELGKKKRRLKNCLKARNRSKSLVHFGKVRKKIKSKKLKENEIRS